jgi:hypothetical protein
MLFGEGPGPQSGQLSQKRREWQTPGEMRQ